MMGTSTTEKKQEWYLADRNNLEAQGPFTREQITAKLLAGEIRLDDYLWNPQGGDLRWHRVIEIEEFKAELLPYPKCPIPKRSQGLSSLLKPAAAPKLNFSAKQGYFGADNSYRRFPRAPVTAEVIVHNQKTYRRGQSIDISEKGVFTKIDDLQAFDKGEEVVVTVKGAPGMGTFSASAVVMRIVMDGEFKGYGFFFLRINPQIRRKIARYVLNCLGSEDPFLYRGEESPSEEKAA